MRESRHKIENPAPGNTRRRFLWRGAVAVAGASAAMALPAQSKKGVKASAKPLTDRCTAKTAPMKDVQGKVAFITGGSSGVGFGIAHALAQAGMKIVITYRTKKHLDEALKSLAQAGDRVHAISVDVTDRVGMERAAQEAVALFGKVHVLVNNAGVVRHAPVSQMTYDDWDWMMNVNLDGVFNGVHAFLPHIQSHGEGGQIITTSSILGLFSGATHTAYSASKFAVIGMMEALRAELLNENIGVSAFCPGLVSSNIADASRNRPAELAETGSVPDAEALARERRFRHDPDRAMDPLQAGALLLRGMRNNDLYILTHPEYEQIMRERHAALIAALPRDLRPTKKRIEIAHAMLSESIYNTGHDGSDCSSMPGAK